MPWEREAFAKVAIYEQLDEAFMGGCQSILDAKLEGYSEEQVKKILAEKGALEVLNMAAKEEKDFNPPPPKVKKVAKEAGDAPRRRRQRPGRRRRPRRPLRPRRPRPQRRRRAASPEEGGEGCQNIPGRRRAGPA